MGNIQELKAFLKLYQKECSSLQKGLVLGRLKDFNEKNGTSHSIEWKQVGMADLYTWEITERWNNLNIDQPLKPLQLRLF